MTNSNEIKKPIFLDIEASSLLPDSFPIEIGFAWISDRNIRSGAELIKPVPQWDMSTWLPKSEAVHGISRQELDRSGLPPEKVAQWILDGIGDASAVVSDAPSYDQRWLDMLLETIGRKGAVRLTDFDALVATAGLDKLQRIYGELDRRDIPHRAAADAERLAWAYAIGTNHPMLTRRKAHEERSSGK